MKEGIVEEKKKDDESLSRSLAPFVGD